MRSRRRRGGGVQITAAILILPLAAYAWTHAPRPWRARAAAIAAIMLAVVPAAFLTLEPNLLSITWNQFAASTAGTRALGGTTSVLHALNLNGRDTLTAGLSALGFVNAAALLVWLVADRRLPAALTRPVAILWAVPWLVLVLAIHIGRRGYILPIVPLAVLVIAGYYARQRRSTGVALVSFQLVANLAQFVWLTPLPATTVGGAELYKDKSISARIASDLDAVTFPTAWTIAASDRRAAALSALVDDICPERDPIIVGEEDWRRVLWYFPRATAINSSGAHVLYSGRNTNFGASRPPARGSKRAAE